MTTPVFMTWVTSSFCIIHILFYFYFSNRLIFLPFIQGLRISMPGSVWKRLHADLQSNNSEMTEYQEPPFLEDVAFYEKI